MKKKVKIASILLSAIMVLTASIVLPHAVTYRVIDNIRFSDIDNSRVMFCGWEDDSEAIVIPDTVGGKTIVMIDAYALYENADVKHIDLSNAVHVQTVGSAAFQECVNLQSIVIPEWMKFLSDRLFMDCSSLESAEFLSDVPKIYEYMFKGCSSLKSFAIPDSVTRIDKFAFGDCTALEYVEVPESVTSIATSAFRNCLNLTLGVYKDSYAQTYAESQNIPYVLIDAEPQEYILGDANGDGAVNINDVTTIQRHLADMETIEGIHFYAADVNSDGSVTIDDATLLQMKFAEYNNVDYPIGEVITQ